MLERRMFSKTKILFVALIWLINSHSHAQQPASDPVLLRVHDREITQSEFEAVYRKNNVDMRVAEPKTVDEYLELFINFNLKVVEAISLGMNENQDLMRELAGYREQLARPYFQDDRVNEQLLHEAWERMQYDIRASHILFNLSPNALAADTLKVYEKAMMVRARALAGEDFSSLAVKFSEDPSVRDRQGNPVPAGRRGAGGDLGYFSVFGMVYPFETAAYETPVGEISMPVRSDFGYHLIKVTDRIPAQGNTTVAHIMTMTPPAATEEELAKAENTIREVWARLQQGDDFTELTSRFSEDRSTSQRGGVMPPFTSARMVPEFVSASSALLEPGDLSGPVRTAFGWHIIKLIERQVPESLEEVRFDLSEQLSRDARSQLSRRAVIDRLKKEYAFTEDREALEGVFARVDASVFRGQWDPGDAPASKAFLFGFAGKVFTQQDLLDYIAGNQSRRSPDEIPAFVHAMYDNFVEQEILAWEDARLEEKYPEFRMIMNEYRDGILLFELTDEKIWTRALQDTLGLQVFYHENIDQYQWGERVEAAVFTVNQRLPARELVASLRNAYQQAGREQEVDPNDAVIDHQLLADQANAENPLEVSLKKDVFAVEDLPLTSTQRSIYGPIAHRGKYLVIDLLRHLPPGPQQIHEIRGILVADYQNYLEQQWVQELRHKYQVEINQEALGRVRKKMESQ